MKLDFEFEVIRNPLLGAAAFWEFSNSYFQEARQLSGATLPMVMLVLPIVYHKRTVDSIRRKHKKSGLLKALSENPEITIGLQERLEAMGDLSLRTLNVACSANLIRRQSTSGWPIYIPELKRLPAPVVPVIDEAKAILSSSRRLGAWFAQEDFVVTISRLRVEF